MSKAQNHQQRKKIAFKFQVGQIVRILKDQTYSKSYTGNFSNILYVITEREYKTGVPVYKLKELLTGEPLIGTWYSAELKLVNIDWKNCLIFKNLWN